MPRSSLALTIGALLALTLGCGSPETEPSTGHGDHQPGATAGVHAAEEAPVPIGDGRSAKAGGYTLSTLTHRDGELSFQILGRGGSPHTKFEREQSVLMHIYVVREDLAEFQHVHPTLAKDGTWRVPLQLRKPGPYRVVTDFAAVGDAGKVDRVVLGRDLRMPGSYRPRRLPPSGAPVRADDYELHLFADLVAGQASTLKVHFTRNGADAPDLQPYLDSYAHLTAFRTGDLAAVHLHPQQAPEPGAHGDPLVEFHAEFPKPGTYRLFIQFKTNSKVHTAAATVRVT